MPMKYPLLVLLLFFSSLYVCFSQTNESESLKEMEGQILKIINEYRSSMGLGELVYNKEVYNEAKKHSLNMAGGITPFSHDGFDKRFERLTKNIDANSMAENVALGQTSAQDAVNSWLSSQGHKQNIEGNFNLTGIGVSRGSNGELYFTQIFLLK